MTLVPLRRLAVVAVRRIGPGDRFRWVAVAVALGACGGDREDAGSGRIPDRMPQVVAAPVPVAQRPVANVLSAVAVGVDGAVLVLPGKTRESSLVLLGAPDGEMREYGRFGEGPGEMRMPFPLLVHDTAVVGFDLGTQRLMVFDRVTTRIQRELRPSASVVPFMRGPGTTLLASRSDRGVELPLLVDLGEGRVRDVVSPSDSYRIALFADDDRYPGGAANTAVIGRWADGVVLANGMTYRIGLYDTRGVLRHRIDRNIAPRQLTPNEIELELSRLRNTPMGRTPERMAHAREQLEATPTRWFTHLSAPRSDGLQRLWVMVEHGDSTSADVYAQDRFLGRVRLDCPGYAGRWDLVGEWLVLLCVPVEPDAPHDAEVRRWRIVD